MVAESRGAMEYSKSYLHRAGDFLLSIVRSCGIFVAFWASPLLLLSTLLLRAGEFDDLLRAICENINDDDLWCCDRVA